MRICLTVTLLVSPAKPPVLTVLDFLTPLVAALATDTFSPSSPTACWTGFFDRGFGDVGPSLLPFVVAWCECVFDDEIHLVGVVRLAERVDHCASRPGGHASGNAQ